MAKKRFQVSVEELTYHLVEIEVEDEDGDIAAGYVTSELLDAVRAAMREQGHHYYFSRDEVGNIEQVEEEE